MSKEQTALERIKDEVAIESGWPGGWSSLADDGYSSAFLNQVAKRFARECCQATLEDLRAKDELLKSIRHALYDRDTDDAILDNIRLLLAKGGYKYESED